MLFKQNEFRLQKEMEIYNKLNLDEKQELFAEIEILKNKGKSVDELQIEYQSKIFFQKWFFFIKLKNLREKYSLKLTDN